MCGCRKHTMMDTSNYLDQILAANLPEDALHIDPSSSGEDERLQAASAAAIQGGTSSPLLKQELRQRILLNRHKAGKPELRPEFNPAKRYELTSAEKAKKERRKEQNRRAARKCRQKKKSQESRVQDKYNQTQERHQRLRKEVDELQRYKTALKTWLVTHVAVCSLWLPSSKLPEQTSLQQQQQQQQLEMQGQHQQQQLQHQQQQPQYLLQQQQQQQLQEYNLPLPFLASTIPETTAVTSCLDESSTLGSQGFDSIISSLQTQDLQLNSQEFDAAIKGLITDQDNVTDGVRCTNSAAKPTAVQTSGPAHYLSSSTASPPCQSLTATTCTMTSGLPPHSTSTPSTSALPIPSSVCKLLQPDHSQAFLQSQSATSSHVETDDPILELPGYPFSTRRKRRSVDSVAQSGKEEAKHPKMMKSATYPRLVTSPAADDVIFTFTSSTDGQDSTHNTHLPNTDAESGPCAQSTYLFPLRAASSVCTQVVGNTSVPRPSPTPSPHSPCCFRFAAVTPPPRSALTPQPSSPLTPPPFSSPHSPGATQPFALGDDVLAAEMAVPVTASAQAGPAPVLHHQPAMEPGSLMDSLGSFLSSSHCEEDAECLSSRTILDLLDGFTSSQEA